MATRKVTITLEEEQLGAVRKLVGSGMSRSVSAFILTKEERDWADGILKAPAGAKRRRRAA